MQEESLYKIVSIILIPFMAILGIMSLFLLFASILNPIVIIILFLFVCVILYYIFSTQFFRKNIMKEQQAKPKLRKRIRWTGFVTVFFLFNAITTCVGSLTDKAKIMQASQQVFEMMEPQLQEMQKSNPAVGTLNAMTLYNAYNVMIIILLIGSLILLLHLLMSFKFVVKYNDLFGDAQEPID